MELLKDLQNRVQEYERNGVEATQDMQRAARKVASDNLRLRALLAHKGVSQESVDTYLRSFDVAENSEDASAAMPTSPGVYGLATPKRLQEPAGYSTQASNHTQGSTFFEERQDNEPQLNPALPALNTTRHHATKEITFSHTTTMLLSPLLVQEDFDESEDNYRVHGSHQTSRSREAQECPDASDCFCAPASTTNDQAVSFGLEISCETAATIIAEMRGDGDKDSVRASLGCGGLAHCSIKNSTVLQIMDER